MMDYQKQLKLQAHLDGELSADEARQVAEWLARDQAAVALAAELKQSRRTMKEYEGTVKLPETREFYWSKIHSAIEREERLATRTQTRDNRLLAQLRRFLVPVAGLALVTLFAMVGFRHTGSELRHSTVTYLDDAQAFTYHDFSSGATLVWLSYPADNRIAGEDELTIIE